MHKRDERAAPQQIPQQIELNVELGPLAFQIRLGSGFFRTNCTQSVLNHNHAEFEIQFVHKGAIVLSMEDGYQTVREGCFCLIPPWLYHAQRRPPSGEDVHKSSFIFSFDVIPGLKPSPNYPAIETEQLYRTLMNVGFFTAPDRTNLFTLLAAIKQELYTQRIGFFAKAQSLFAQLLVEIIRSSPHSENAPQYGLPAQTPDDSRLTIIETFFTERFALPMKEDDLAGLLYVSNRQLNRILHDLYGMSFRTKLLHTRIKVAMDLLKNSDLPVKDIAAQVGYPFAENFHSSFKAQTGMTPTAFRNHSRGGSSV